MQLSAVALNQVENVRSKWKRDQFRRLFNHTFDTFFFYFHNTYNQSIIIYFDDIQT